MLYHKLIITRYEKAYRESSILNIYINSSSFIGGIFIIISKIMFIEITGLYGLSLKSYTRISIGGYLKFNNSQQSAVLTNN